MVSAPDVADDTQPVMSDDMPAEARRQMEAVDRAVASRTLKPPRPDPERALHDTVRRQRALLERLAALHARHVALCQADAARDSEEWSALEGSWRSVLAEVDIEVGMSHKTNIR